MESISVSYKLATIAVVGEGMKKRREMQESLLRGLAASGIRVLATSDGTSDTTLAVVVPADEADRAIETLHCLLFADKTVGK